MRGCEAYAHTGDGARYGTEQFGETERSLSILTHPLITIDILTEQRNLLETASMEVVHFLEDALQIPTAFTPTSIGHDAIVAEIVTSAGDTHKTTQLTAANALRNNVAVGLREREFRIHRLMSRFRLRHQVGQRQIGIRSRHEVCMMLIEKSLLHALCHTSQHTDNKLAPMFPQAVEFVEAMNDALLSFVAH